ncbi:MAG: FtsQ-type POTRA domain-containing protein [Parachlamydiaceae bacterium]|nr:FtsQ-type POTRA domain-containing protein [Parachlamydiaceae bacterium]
MSNSPAPKLSLKKAFLSILLSVIIVSGSCFGGLIYYNQLKDNRRNDPKNQIVAVVQTSPDSEGLKTAYLIELLELSIDTPNNLYAFNSKEALKRLQSSPVIKEAKINKIHPGTIWVDYSLRKPVAILGDYSNTMIDREGIPFPKSFFTPKKLPEIFLGRLEEESSEDTGAEKKFTWGTPINGKRLRLVFALLDFFNHNCNDGITHLERIDVSKAFSLSYGQRQIVLMLEDSCEKEINGKPHLCIYPRMLRLDSDTYEEQLQCYLALRTYLYKNESPPSNVTPESIYQANTMIIDLRISDLAFMHSI